LPLLTGLSKDVDEMNPSRPHRSKADEITRITRPGSES